MTRDKWLEPSEDENQYSFKWQDMDQLDFEWDWALYQSYQQLGDDEDE